MQSCGSSLWFLEYVSPQHKSYDCEIPLQRQNVHWLAFRNFSFIMKIPEVGIDQEKIAVKSRLNFNVSLLLQVAETVIMIAIITIIMIMIITIIVFIAIIIIIIMMIKNDDDDEKVLGIELNTGNSWKMNFFEKYRI